MNASCPAPAQLHALVAGELSENDRHAVEQHLAACAGCRAELEATRAAVQALARPVKLSATPEELAARILAQLDQAAVVPLRPRRRAWLAATASAVAAAAALLFVLAPRGGFQPRGGGERPLERAGIDLYAPLAPDATPLAPGAHL